MTIDKAMAQADRLRPNTLEDMLKASWVCEVERRMARAVGRPLCDLHWPVDGAAELAIEGEYSRIYVLYLCAMIDFTLGEYESYNNTLTLLGSLMEEYKKQYLRNHLPAAQSHKGVWRDSR